MLFRIGFCRWMPINPMQCRAKAEESADGKQEGDCLGRDEVKGGDMEVGQGNTRRKARGRHIMEVFNAFARPRVPVSSQSGGFADSKGSNNW